MNIKNIFDQNIKDVIKFILENKKNINHYLREKIYLKKNRRNTIDHMRNIKNISTQLNSRLVEVIL